VSLYKTGARSQNLGANLVDAMVLSGCRINSNLTNND
jgi:hypothetical protein